MKPLLFICGPTASGKTAFAIELARKLEGEIISADSMQVYQGMDIGTAKPTPEELERAPHHLIGCVSPEENFSAARYAQMAEDILLPLQQQDRWILFCGGTGMYMDALLYGLDAQETGADPALREELTAFAREKGNEALHAKLKALNPQAAETIHPNNVKRVIRAIEMNGTLPDKPISERKARFPYKRIVLTMPREMLYARINRRVDLMVEQGLVQEAEAFYREYAAVPTARYAIGYKELFDHFEGRCSLEEAVEKIKQETRRYAKRQITWFKRYEDAIFLDMGVGRSLQACINEVLQQIKE